MIINFYSDRGHGWAEVPFSEVKGLAISSYSYKKGEFAYLEEDCDLGVYLDTLRARGIAFTFNETHSNGDSPIRGYQRF